MTTKDHFIQNGLCGLVIIQTPTIALEMIRNNSIRPASWMAAATRLALSPPCVQIHGRLVDSAPKIIELPVVFFRYCPASDFDCICSEKNGNVVAIIRWFNYNLIFHIDSRDTSHSALQRMPFSDELFASSIFPECPKQKQKWNENWLKTKHWRI